MSAQASALSRAPGVLIAINQLLKRMSDSLSPLQSEDLLLCAKHLFVEAIVRTRRERPKVKFRRIKCVSGRFVQ